MCLHTKYKIENPSAGINDLNDLSSMIVSPNPSNDVFNVSFDTEKNDVKLTLTDLKGSVIFEQTYSQIQETSFSASTSGVYILTIQTGNSSRKISIIKQ